ncbi:DUF2796 domain-containing protein [Azomonas macrocytogenes]|uniref:DUF2796 domain-containing protein n=1 Tax=Azomonas macrocytogenes TaxID=69962 RepID=A0A839T0Q0_AZOMA|nr:DUF2796 domain-containing protein [Azomonas macrocytogenes]MBB3103147.1 hypothetical protein [Azomonas macrocytogenes]
MCYRLLALLLLLQLSITQAHASHEHASLGAHEHGAATLNVVLEDRTLEVELETPAMNLVGFEHAATSAADKARVVQVKERLRDPVALFGVPVAAGCRATATKLDGALLEEEGPVHEDEHEDAAEEHGHSDIQARYKLVCQHPESLTALDLTRFFELFPDTHKVSVQSIGPSGQHGFEATPGNPQLAL